MGGGGESAGVKGPVQTTLAELVAIRRNWCRKVLLQSIFLTPVHRFATGIEFRLFLFSLRLPAEAPYRYKSPDEAPGEEHQEPAPIEVAVVGERADKSLIERPQWER